MKNAVSAAIFFVVSFFLIFPATVMALPPVVQLTANGNIIGAHQQVRIGVEVHNIYNWRSNVALFLKIDSDVAEYSEFNGFFWTADGFQDQPAPVFDMLLPYYFTGLNCNEDHAQTCLFMFPAHSLAPGTYTFSALLMERKHLSRDEFESNPRMTRLTFEVTDELPGESCPDFLNLVLENSLTHDQYGQLFDQLNAHQDDPYCQAGLSTLYNRGAGVEQNSDLAYQYAWMSAQQGHPKGQALLGNRYYTGVGTEADFDQAYYWYDQAARQGDCEGQIGLGFAYFLGNGTEQSHEKAYNWFYKAAVQETYSSVYAREWLGYLYENGYGVDKDYAQAYHWFNLAAASGSSYAQVSIGFLYEHGLGVDQSYAQAYKWYRVSAEQGNPEAQQNLGWQYLEGNAKDQDFDQAFKWFMLAAEQGHSGGQLGLGVIYISEESRMLDYTQARHWFSLAANQEEAWGHYGLGYLYSEGLGAIQNKLLACQHFTAAAELGLDQAVLEAERVCAGL